jgi:ribosome biogenesis protein SSF1/2
MLQERKNNKLRDYTTMTGPLGVTHLLLFSKSSSGNTNLRIAITPRGPTLHFRVENYSLSKDVHKSQRHPKEAKSFYLRAPLLVMNNFTTSSSSSSTAPNDSSNGDKERAPPVPKHLEQLVTTIFQSLFPPLSPQSTPLPSIKRVLLLNREPPSNPSNSAYTITLRHYAISTKAVGLPKPIKRLNAVKKSVTKQKRGKGLPNLGKLEDVADWMLQDPADGSYTSASESEPDTDAEVEVLETNTRRLPSRHEKKSGSRSQSRRGVERRGIKLTELGPRMRLRLMKVEDGVCTGKVMWHEYIQMSKKEEKEQDKMWEQRRKEKEERKRVQKENLEKKREEKAGNTKRGQAAEESEGDDFEDWDSDMLDAYEDVEDGEESGNEDEAGDAEMKDAEEG